MYASIVKTRFQSDDASNHARERERLFDDDEIWDLLLTSKLIAHENGIETRKLIFEMITFTRIWLVMLQ